MTVRPVTWRFWSVTASCIGAYIGFGFWLSGNGTVEEWLYRFGLLGAAVAPIAFVVIYTILGLRGRAKWWTNTLSAALVLAALSLVPIAGPLAYVFWFMNGYLHQSWLAWIEVSGPALSALAWLWLCLVWLWLYRVGSGAALTPPDGFPAAD